MMKKQSAPKPKRQSKCNHVFDAEKKQTVKVPKASIPGAAPGTPGATVEKPKAKPRNRSKSKQNANGQTQPKPEPKPRSRKKSTTVAITQKK